MCTSWYFTPVLFWTRSITCLKSHPVLLSDSSCFILPISSFGMAEGFPLLCLSLRPSIPSSPYLLCHLYAHDLALCSSLATDSMCCLSDDTLIISSILSFTRASRSLLYTLSSFVEFDFN